MIPVAITRHKTVFSSQGRVDGTVGEQIGTTIRTELYAIPRKGELLTFHPDRAPSERSWTGEVTGIQHVIGYGMFEPLVCLTVRDEKEIQRR